MDKINVLAPYDFYPLTFHSCDITTRLERIDNLLSGKFKARQALSCAICGVMYQLVDNRDIFRAATASGGELVEYFVGDDEQEELGNGKK